MMTGGAVGEDWVIGPSTMFRGKDLPGFLRRYAPLFAELVRAYGRDKVDKVYDFFFAFAARMQFGQWMVVQKVCPDIGQRALFYYVMELIYQSDLLSQFRFCYAPLRGGKPGQREVRLTVMEPRADRRDELLRLGLIEERRYKLFDWYGNYRLNHDINPQGIDPAWLLLNGATADDAADGDTDSGLTDDGEALPA